MLNGAPGESLPLEDPRARSEVEPFLRASEPAGEILSEAEGPASRRCVPYHAATRHFNATVGAAMSIPTKEPVLFRNRLKTQRI